MAEGSAEDHLYSVNAKHNQDAKHLFAGQPIGRLSSMHAAHMHAAAGMHPAASMHAAAGMHMGRHPPSRTPPPAHSGLAAAAHHNFLQIQRPSPHGSPFAPPPPDEMSGSVLMSQLFSLPPTAHTSRLSPMPSSAPLIHVTPPPPPLALQSCPPSELPHQLQQLLHHQQKVQMHQHLGLIQGASLACSRTEPSLHAISQLLKTSTRPGGLTAGKLGRHTPSPGRSSRGHTPSPGRSSIGHTPSPGRSSRGHSPMPPPAPTLAEYIRSQQAAETLAANEALVNSKLYQHLMRKADPPLSLVTSHVTSSVPSTVTTTLSTSVTSHVTTSCVTSSAHVWTSVDAVTNAPRVTSSEAPTRGSRADMRDSRYSVLSRQVSETMPRLVPAVPFPPASDDTNEDKENEEETEESNTQERKCPYNMRVITLNNLPCQQSGYRAQYRSHSVAITRAKVGTITSTAKSLDILRQNLQKHINKEIDKVIQHYINSFFKVGLDNIKLNKGENSVSDEHTLEVCRQILEEAKKMYVVERRSVTPDTCDNVSETGSLVESSVSRTNKHNLLHIRKRRGSSDSEASLPRRKKKGRPPLHLQGTSGRSTPSKTGKVEPVKKEGPKWDPDRIKADTEFVMGARANKVLGLGATRGRIYIKHPEVFKYSGDQDDKQWLYEKQYMPTTGGKAYMLIVSDIEDLASTREYKNNSNVLMDELHGFTLPEHILQKVRIQMKALRTDSSCSKTASTLATSNTNESHEGSPEKVPFTNSEHVHKLLFSDVAQPSPATTEEVLADEDDDDDDVQSGASPFQMSRRFDTLASADISPSLSELDDDDPPLTAPFQNSLPL